MRVYQKLENPQLVELESDMIFVIVTEISVSEMKYGLIFMRGKSFNYEDGNLEAGEVKEIQYSTKEDAYYDVDENGEIID